MNMLKLLVGLLLLVSAQVRAETPTQGCLSALRVPPPAQLTEVGPPTKRLLEQSAKDAGKAGFSYKIEFEYSAQGWTLLVLDSDVTDERHYFYSGDPLTQPPAVTWGGAVAPWERKAILSWLKKAAPGIPNVLANCWASATVKHQI